MSGAREFYEDELSLKDVLNVFKSYKKVIFLTPILFVIITAVITWLFITPRYQAFVTVELGQVNSKVLEGSAVAEERMKDRSFIATVIGKHPDIFRYQKDLAEEEEFLQKNLIVKKSKDADNLISFSLLGRSREIAQQKANAVFETLKIYHTAIFEADVAMVNQQLHLIDDQIALINKSRLSGRDGGNALNSYNAVVDSLVMQDQVRQLRDLQNQKMALTLSLSSAVTFNTRILGNVWVSQKPVTPDYQVVLLVAFFLGLFGSIFGAFLHHSLKD